MEYWNNEKMGWMKQECWNSGKMEGWILRTDSVFCFTHYSTIQLFHPSMRKGHAAS